MEPTSLEDARAILRANLLDLDAVRNYFHVRVSALWRARLREVPFDRIVLKEFKDTHLLFAGVPLSILDLRKRTDQRLFQRPLWYARDQFARDERVTLRWYLLRKDVVPGSMGRAFMEQVPLLGEEEEVPRACEAAYGILLYFLARGVRLFANTCARCIDLALSEGTPAHARIDVGDFNDSGIGVALWDDEPDEGIGLASMVVPTGAKKQKLLQR